MTDRLLEDGSHLLLESGSLRLLEEIGTIVGPSTRVLNDQNYVLAHSYDPTPNAIRVQLVNTADSFELITDENGVFSAVYDEPTQSLRVTGIVVGPMGDVTIDGDMTFAANKGPVLVDRSDGHTYRLKVTGGVLGTEVVT